MFLVAAVVAVGLALALGGKLSNLARVEVRGLPYIVASLGVRLAGVLLTGKVLPSVALCTGIHVISYGLLLYGLYLNFSIPEFRLIALGSFLNFLVIVVNGGRMPVLPQAIDPVDPSNAVLFSNMSLTHQIINESTRLVFLCDIFKFSFLQRTPKAFSPGDAIMVAGLVPFIVRSMKGRFSSPGPHGTMDD
ncbi:MAG: DUF5317 domain-containing protein [Firmicutes bacterium]|nr:DUF5317 domain-containing protein [Candidatus Fermentithermobacillaceae bacterium]